jgi:hypothetical protein
VRALSICLLIAGPAAADPDQKPPPAPPITIKIEPPTNQVITPSDRTPGIGGIDALGKVLVPEPHADAALWPFGALIVPPDVGDQNVLVPGTMQLPWWKPRKQATGPVSKELLDGIEGGVGAFIELLVPPSS